MASLFVYIPKQKEPDKRKICALELSQSERNSPNNPQTINQIEDDRRPPKPPYNCYFNATACRPSLFEWSMNQKSLIRGRFGHWNFFNWSETHRTIHKTTNQIEDDWSPSRLTCNRYFNATPYRLSPFEYSMRCKNLSRGRFGHWSCLNRSEIHRAIHKTVQLLTWGMHVLWFHTIIVYWSSCWLIWTVHAAVFHQVLLVLWLVEVVWWPLVLLCMEYEYYLHKVH